MRTDAQTAAHNGAVLLDRYIPDWYQHVSTRLGGIVLTSSYKCVLAQIGLAHPELKSRFWSCYYDLPSMYDDVFDANPFSRISSWLYDQGAVYDIETYGFNGFGMRAHYWRKEIRARKRIAKRIATASRDLRIVKVEPEYELVA